jgi:hypothetical protein
MLRFGATKDVCMTTADLCYAKRSHRRSKARHSVNLAEKSGFSMECLSPREDVALVRDRDGEVWARSHKFHISTFQCWHFSEFWHISRSTMTSVAINRRPLAVDFP